MWTCKILICDARRPGPDTRLVATVAPLPHPIGCPPGPPGPPRACGKLRTVNARAALRRRWYWFLEHSPRVYCSYVRWRQPGRTVVDSSTDLVIDGIGGSGNSFITEYVRQANRDRTVASHQHSPAHLRESIRLGVPAVLIVRSPADSIASLMARRDDYLDAPGHLRRYHQFHARLRRHLDDLIVVPFEQAVNEPEVVVERINERSGLALRTLDAVGGSAADVTDALVKEVAQIWGEEVAAGHAPVPQETRSEANAAARAELASPRNARLMARATAAYEQTLAAARPLGVGRPGPR